MAVGTETKLVCRACDESMDRERGETPYVAVTVEGREDRYGFCMDCTPFVLDILDGWRTGYASSSRCGRCRDVGELTVVEARIAREFDGFRSVGVRSYRLCPDCLPAVEAL